MLMSYNGAGPCNSPSEVPSLSQVRIPLFLQTHTDFELKIEVLSKIRAYIQTTPPEDGAWIEGQGWDQTLWGGVFPTAADLDDDPVVKGKPIVLARTDVHAYWVGVSFPLYVALVDSQTV